MIETLKLNSASPAKITIFAPKGFSSLYRAPDFVSIKEIESGELLKGNDFSISAVKVKHTENSFGFIFKENEKIKFYEEKAHSLGMQGTDFTSIQKKGYLVKNNRKIKLQQVSYKRAGIKIAYSGDCLPSISLVKAAKECDILIHESTFGNELEEQAKEKMHSTAAQAAAIAMKAKVKQLILVHISPRYSKKSNELLLQACAVFKNTIIAEDGITINI